MENNPLSWPAGVKKTKQRKMVFAILKDAKQPMTAMDICSKMEDKTDSAWLSTVYRVLEFFVKSKMVVKIKFPDNDKAVYELNRFQHKHYAICMNCHKVIAMENCPMENFTPKLEEDDFQILGHKLELFGYCKNCAPTE